MKLAISTLVCPQWTLEKIVEAAAANRIGGIDFRGLGAEIDVTKLPVFNEQIETTLELLRSHRIVTPCLNTSVTLVTPAAERWQMMLEEAQRTVRLARKMQTKFMRVFAGAAVSGMSRGEAVQMGQRRLRQLVKMCNPVVPVVETHDQWATAQQMLELVHEFDPGQVGVLWDVEHTHRAGENVEQTFSGMKRFVHHVHFKDSMWIDGKNSPRLLGEGDLPLKECCATLREGGYAGWICLETEKRWHPEAPEPGVSIPQFARLMKQIFLPQMNTDKHR
jgi:sugar phosphate isomerase/epimerase